MIKNFKKSIIFFLFPFSFSFLPFSFVFLSLFQSMAGDKATKSGQHSISKKEKPSKSDIIHLIQKIHSNHKSQIHISIKNKYPTNKYQILPKTNQKINQSKSKTKHKYNFHCNSEIKTNCNSEIKICLPTPKSNFDFIADWALSRPGLFRWGGFATKGATGCRREGGRQRVS